MVDASVDPTRGGNGSGAVKGGRSRCVASLSTAWDGLGLSRKGRSSPHIHPPRARVRRRATNPQWSRIATPAWSSPRCGREASRQGRHAPFPTLNQPPLANKRPSSDSCADPERPSVPGTSAAIIPGAGRGLARHSIAQEPTHIVETPAPSAVDRANKANFSRPGAGRGRRTTSTET